MIDGKTMLRFVGKPPSADNDDLVNHPAHYTSHPKGIECLDVIEDCPHYNIGAAMKYQWRVAFGDGKGDEADQIRDLKKARFLLDREISRREPGDFEDVRDCVGYEAPPRSKPDPGSGYGSRLGLTSAINNVDSFVIGAGIFEIDDPIDLGELRKLADACLHAAALCVGYEEAALAGRRVD